MPNFIQQVASGKHYDKIKSIGISHSNLKKYTNSHFNRFGSMDKSKFEIGYDQNNQIIPFGEICWEENGGNKHFVIGQINDSDLNLKNTAQSNQMIVYGGMWERIDNTPGVKIMITRWSNGNCYIREYHAKGKYRWSVLNTNGNMRHGNYFD